MQIRDLDDDVYAALARRAGEAGVSVPDLLRREASRFASRPSLAEWLERTNRRPSQISRTEVINALAEALGATLLTLDQRLATAPGLRCAVEVPQP